MWCRWWWKLVWGASSPNLDDSPTIATIIFFDWFSSTLHKQIISKVLSFFQHAYYLSKSNGKYSLFKPLYSLVFTVIYLYLFKYTGYLWILIFNLLSVEFFFVIIDLFLHLCNLFIDLMLHLYFLSIYLFQSINDWLIFAIQSSNRLLLSYCFPTSLLLLLLLTPVMPLSNYSSLRHGFLGLI